ncbi:hypothetical protein COCON_G00034580 [Conger conger]|uniref:EamA domain-containing protein n=1 Tax=Conger conger TaxID=82655 RepID=A0A9Q1I7L9_CONCO|nr:hypothetical protein COCON_G00034580 [Conger conger]
MWLHHLLPPLLLLLHPGENLVRENTTVIADGHPAGAGAAAESRGGGQTLRCCLHVTVAHLRKTLWGVAMVTCVCSTWTGSTQLAKVTFRQFDAPFTLTWFATTWNILVFPLYYMVHVCRSSERLTPWQSFRQCSRLFGDNGMTVRTVVVKTAPFGLLWTMTLYLYLQALRKLSTTDASALFCCNKAFVFLLSWILLRDRFMGVRIVAAILAIAGIVMMTYADGFHSRSVIAISFVVASASTSAMYKVLFKMVLGSAKFGEAALVLTVIGGANLILVSPVPLVLYFTGVEHFSSPSDIPWGCLCGVAGLLLAFNLLVNFGVAITYPTLISLGVILSVPVNALVDLHTCEIQFNTVRLIAIALICLGFLLLLLPEDWDRALLHVASRLRKQDQPAEGGTESRRTPSSMPTFGHQP